MAINLYDHQKDALKRMKNGCILCGGVGSGKSITSLAYYHQLCGGYLNPFKKMAKPVDLYIITTAKKRDEGEWDKELIPFLLSSGNKDYDISVTIDSWNNIKKYTEVKNSFFIFDEQRVIGSGSWVKSFYKITKKNQNQWKFWHPLIRNNLCNTVKIFYQCLLVLNWCCSRSAQIFAVAPFHSYF